MPSWRGRGSPAGASCTPAGCSWRCPGQFLLGPDDLSHAPLGVLLGLDKLLYTLEGEVPEVDVECALLHDVRGDVGVPKSPQHGMQNHPVRVAGLAVKEAEAAVPCHALQTGCELLDAVAFLLLQPQEVLNMDQYVGRLDRDHLVLGQDVFFRGGIDFAVVVKACLEVLGAAVPQLQD